MTEVSFWCKKCRRDMDLLARLVREERGEAFVSKCPHCNSELVRLVSNPSADEYYVSSKRVILESRKYARDLLQPGDEGFSMRYRKSWEALERKREEYEAEEVRKKAERDAYYKKLKGHGGENRSLARKVLATEERLRHG